MNLELLEEFFMWLTIINFVMVVIFYLMIRSLVSFDFLYNTFVKNMYLGTKEEFNKMIVGTFFTYRILFGFFCALYLPDNINNQVTILTFV